MQTSTRRTEAAAAVKAPSAAVKATADAQRRTKEGTATRADAERLDALAAVKAGAIARERESALELVALVQAQIAAGITPTDGAYILKYDAEGEPIDARDVVADALAPHAIRDASGNVTGSTPSRRATRPSLPWQITDADLIRLAWGAVKVAARVAAGSSPDTFREAHAEAVAAMVAVAPQSPCGCTATLRRRYGSPLAWIAAVESGAVRADCPRCNGARCTPQLDRRYHAVKDGERVPLVDVMAQAGRNAAQRLFEADRRAAPLDADELAAAAQEAAQGALSTAQITADEWADALGANRREAAALAVRVAGISRADLAAVHGVTVDTVKKDAQRGAKLLAERLSVANIGAVARRIVAADPVDVAEAERKIRTLIGGTVHTGERSLPGWPERFSGYDDDNAPTFRFTGTGTAARVPVSHHGGAPALPSCYRPTAAAPWSTAEQRAAAERAAIRRALAQRKGRSWRPTPSSGKLADCILPNMAEDAARERVQRVTALRSLLVTERAILNDDDAARRATLLPTVSALVLAACRDEVRPDALTRRAASAAAMLRH